MVAENRRDWSDDEVKQGQVQGPVRTVSSGQPGQTVLGLIWVPASTYM